MLITRPGSPRVAIVQSRMPKISFSKPSCFIFKIYLPFKYLIYIIFCLLKIAQETHRTIKNRNAGEEHRSSNPFYQCMAIL